MSKEIIKQPRFIPSLEQTIEICNLYGIGDLISVAGEIKNTVNVNIKILTKTGPYVIKIFTGKLERLNSIIEILKILNYNNVPALLPLKNMRGEYYSQIGPYMVQITKYEYGYPFVYGKHQAWSSGRVLRRFHDVLSDIGDPLTPAASTYPSVKTLRAGITSLLKMQHKIPMNQINSVTHLYYKIIEKWEVRSANLPKTIIHGDWHQGNQLYSESGDIFRIMDFEFMTRAERLFDIAYAIWYSQHKKKSMDFACHFMKGYGLLSHEEIQLLPLEIARISFFFICTSSLSLNPEYELNNQINQQFPFIKWALSKEGKRAIRNICVKK